jgi:hypothetical protein
MYHIKFFIFQEKQNAVVTYTAVYHLKKVLSLYVRKSACEDFIVMLIYTLVS